ncbi:MAG: hypothetical protein HY360_04425 [Verrucomicrobia bacterium]|nr:hypothetical protein [Verrucomicrobiota bacterium]
MKTIATETLAIRGGQPSITQPLPKPVRWGDAARDQLAGMIAQSSLFYWNGPQTKLLPKQY